MLKTIKLCNTIRKIEMKHDSIIIVHPSLLSLYITFLNSNKGLVQITWYVTSDNTNILKLTFIPISKHIITAISKIYYNKSKLAKQFFSNSNTLLFCLANLSGSTILPPRIKQEDHEGAGSLT